MSALTSTSWHTHRTPSGLTIAVHPMANKVVTIDVWVATGSAREDDRSNGVSHFLEHMLFKGTPRFGVGELDRHIMQLGGVWNAGTSMDFTHYYVTVAAPYFTDALDAIADMVQHATIDPTEFEKEKLVILEEYRRKQDDPWGWLFDKLYSMTYLKGPYKRTVLGTFESISGLTRELMVDYYRRTYTADAITVLVAGEIDPNVAIEQVERFFCDLPTPEQPWPAPDEETLFAHGVKEIVARDVHEAYVGMAYPGPAIHAYEEAVALDLLTVILGAGRSSRLTQRLREQLGLVEEIGMSFASHKAPGLTYIYAVTQDNKLDNAIAEIGETLRQLLDAPPSDQELAKAKRILRNDLYYSTETTSGQTNLMGYYLTLTKSEDFYYRYLPLVEATTVQDLLGAAERYLLAEPPVTLAVVPAHASTQHPSAKEASHANH